MDGNDLRNDATVINSGLKVVESIKPVDPAVTNTDDSLSWEDIQNAQDIDLVPVDVPEWGKMPDGSPKKAYLKMLSAGEAIRLTKDLQDKEKRAEGMLEIVHRSLVDPKTRLPLVPPGKMAVFASKSVRVFTRLQKRALEINGMQDEVKEIEAAKND